MIFRLNALRGEMADRGKKNSLEEISSATGISRKALTELSKGRVRCPRPEYIDALCAYFNVGVGELIEAEPVTLPLKLNVRPDRRGARVGEKTRAAS